MVKYEPTCTYEIQSFLDEILFWNFRRYVIVKIDPGFTQETSYHKQFFNSGDIDYDTICWGNFDRATHYFRYNKAFSDLNKILSVKSTINLRLEYSTKDYKSFEDPLEKRFKELEHGKNIQAQNKY